VNSNPVNTTPSNSVNRVRAGDAIWLEDSNIVRFTVNNNENGIISGGGGRTGTAPFQPGGGGADQLGTTKSNYFYTSVGRGVFRAADNDQTYMTTYVCGSTPVLMGIGNTFHWWVYVPQYCTGRTGTIYICGNQFWASGPFAGWSGNQGSGGIGNHGTGRPNSAGHAINKRGTSTQIYWNGVLANAGATGLPSGPKGGGTGTAVATQAGSVFNHTGTYPRNGIISAS